MLTNRTARISASFRTVTMRPSSSSTPDRLPNLATSLTKKVKSSASTKVRYTIGQRRGLGISAPESLYVCGKSLDTNKVILGGKDDLMSNYCYINDINLIPWNHLDKPIQCKVKTRYRQPEQPATVEQLGDDLIVADGVQIF